MAHLKTALSRQGTSQYAAGKSASFFFYAHSDVASTMLASGYFNDSREALSPGDVIIASAVVDGSGDVLLIRVDTVPATGDVTTSAETGASGA